MQRSEGNSVVKAPSLYVALQMELLSLGLVASVFPGQIPGPEVVGLRLKSRPLLAPTLRLAGNLPTVGTYPLWGPKRLTKCWRDVEVKRDQEGLGRQQATNHHTRGSSAGHVT